MTFLQKIRELLYDVSYLAFPKLCPACNEEQPIHADLLCLRCQAALKPTGYEKIPENPLMDRFYGRVDVVSAMALYYFTKEGRIQTLIHDLKYKQQHEIGTALGEQIGKTLLHSYPYQKADAIVPVPLHPDKKLMRGYNQSDYIANGISQVMEVPVMEEALRRITYKESQTRKGRLERLTNVNEAFALGADARRLQNKHVLLVDDVVTTGATLEACCRLLTDEAKARVSIVTAAISV